MRIIFRNVGVIMFVFFLHLYFYGSEHIKKFDYEFYDFISMIANEWESSKDEFYSVIIDIDEKSLEQLGQWPWPRVIDAQLIQQITALQPSIIGLNILFSEEDRTSPRYIQKFYKDFFDLTLPLDSFPQALKDNDKLLAKSIKKSKSTLAVYLDNHEYTSTHCQNISYRNNLFSDMKTEFQGRSLLCNYQVIQESSENFGFINAWRDSDGVFRRLPLFMRYREQIFPSFALATLLSFDKYINIDKEEIIILAKFSKNKPKIFSAIDVLNAKIPQDEIQGKIVILGSSVVGLSPQYIISTSDTVSNNMIHAVVIDNILSQTFLKQPDIYKKINMLFSLLFSIIIFFLLLQKLYIQTVGLLVMLLLSSILWLIKSYIEGIYISIGYFWTPLFYFLIFVVIYHLRMISQERAQQEKFLIRQSKLASLGEIITLIAHQWRQPLSTINGIVLNIDIDQRKKVLDADRLDRHLEKIEDTTAYLSKTINDFMDFFSKNKKKEQFNLKNVIEQAIQLTGLPSHKRIEVSYCKDNAEDKDIVIIGYKSELIQSLLIILNNAVYACQKKISETGEEGRIIFDCTNNKEKIFLAISDNGGGIDSKNFKKIFNPYFTTKDKNHGTGLGLYILKILVEDSLNGKVTVHNNRVGAVFTLQIPFYI